MKSRHLTGLALAFSLVLATAASAATETISGRVVGRDLDSSTIIVETDAGQRVAFQTSSTTHMERKSGEALALANLQVGDRVEIASDKLVYAPMATRVILVAPVAGGIVVAPSVDRIGNQTDNTGKAPGYRPSQYGNDDDSKD